MYSTVTKITDMDVCGPRSQDNSVQLEAEETKYMRRQLAATAPTFSFKAKLDRTTRQSDFRVKATPEQANPLRSMKTFACPKRCTSVMSETNGERHKIPKVNLMYEPTLKPCISAQSASTVYTYICPAYVRKYCGILYVIM